MKKRVLSGIRATGRLHLGNYLGAVRGMLELQESSDYETFYMVADLHAITTPYDKESLRENAKEVVRDYLAAGLDPKKSTLFVQSDVPEHTELAYFFSTAINVATLQHLPTFKEKVKQYPEEVTMALLYYPVLMSSDILLYKAEKVPVGIDQEPHLEIARKIARKMNDKFGTDFPEPTIFKTEGEYVPSLTGEGKMSKSVEGSYINLTDDIDTIREKLSKTPTDSGKGKITKYQKEPVSLEGYKKYESDHRVEAKGVAALMYLVELFQSKEKRKEYEKLYTTTGVKYAELKESLAASIYRDLKPIQERREKLTDKEIEKVLQEGAKEARKVASATIKEVKEKMGLYG